MSFLQFNFTSQSFKPVIRQRHSILTMKKLYKCPYYWGKLDQQEAETILKNKPEYSFLIYNKSKGKFDLTIAIKNLYISHTLYETTYEYMQDIRYPVLRDKPFPLKDLTMVVISDSTTFDNMSKLEIPVALKKLLREYRNTNKDIERLDDSEILYIDGGVAWNGLYVKF